MGPLALFLCSPFWLFFLLCNSQSRLATAMVTDEPKLLRIYSLEAPSPKRRKKVGDFAAEKWAPFCSHLLHCTVQYIRNMGLKQ